MELAVRCQVRDRTDEVVIVEGDSVRYRHPVRGVCIERNVKPGDIQLMTIRSVEFGQPAARLILYDRSGSLST
jgi:hypothetical protein